MVSEKKESLSRLKRYRGLSLPQNFSNEEMARDWTLCQGDREEVGRYRKNTRPYIAMQLCALRLYGRFLSDLHELSPRILNYLNQQLGLPPALSVNAPRREATWLAHRKNILSYLGFRRFDEPVQEQLASWVKAKAAEGILPGALFQLAEEYLLSLRVVLPGPSVLERLIINTCSTVHEQTFESVYHRLSPELRRAMDDLLVSAEGEQRSYFSKLKEYPPSAKISSLKTYLGRYRALMETGIEKSDLQFIEPSFQDYLFRVAKRYSARHLKRFKAHKRYALMVCFLLETRKALLDHLVKLHDQYVTDICRKARNVHEKKHREFRKRQKKAVDVLLDTTKILLDWPEDQPLEIPSLWQQVDEERLRTSIGDLQVFKRMEERGYGDLLLTRYPGLRKYFAEFIRLPFAAEPGSQDLMQAIHLVRKLDEGDLKQLPENAPANFVPRELRRALKDKSGKLTQCLGNGPGPGHERRLEIRRSLPTPK